MRSFRNFFRLRKSPDVVEQEKPVTKKTPSPVSIGKSRSENSSTKSPVEPQGQNAAVETNHESSSNNLGFTTPVDHRPKPQNMTIAQTVVYDWVVACQTHDMAKLEELTDISSVFVFEEADGAMIEFRARDILAVINNFWEGFPDCAYGYDSIEEGAKDDNGLVPVALVNFRWFGHHTGVPYTHEPYPPIPAEGKYLLDGPLTMTFRIGQLDANDTLQIKRTTAKGRNMGPHGTYEKLGGMII